MDFTYQKSSLSLFSYFRTVRISKLVFINQNKSYQLVKEKKTPNGSEFSGTWDDFCNLLNLSVYKVDLDIQNLQSFVEESLKSMSRMGIVFRELRQYRKLKHLQRVNKLN
ncbi:hypothetical protein ACGH6Q_12300 [Gilliamella sp. BG2]|uniref:hypothetical protein n=1 Tax=Gilliamella sp. BG2 TaxID=3351509 RepID=UPI00398657ED